MVAEDEKKDEKSKERLDPSASRSKEKEYSRAEWKGEETIPSQINGRDQINIQEGEKVEVLEHDADGYTQVRNSKGDKGRVPTEVEPGEKIGKKWIAAKDYNCYGVRGHINIQKGDKVEVLEEPDDSGLMKVKNDKGEE